MLTKKTKYALKALIYLSLHPEQQISAKEIAIKEHIPYKFLEAILSELKHHGIVSSRRGITGGFMLARDRAKITVGEVVRVIDGPTAPLHCASLTAYRHCDDCTSEEACGVRHVMIETREAINSVMDKQTLADISNFEKLHMPEETRGLRE